MVFSSLTFLFIFLPIVLALYYFVPSKGRNAILLLFSLLFYAFGEPFYILLLVLTILFNYVSGLELEELAGHGKAQKISLLVAVGVNLLLLGCFKYYGLFVRTLNACFSLGLKVKELALPIGISFYTFQSISYLIDIVRGRAKVQRSFIRFALYIAMFPQLIAGPIVRYEDIDKQLEDREVTFQRLGEGTRRFIVGLAKKVILANGVGQIFEEVMVYHDQGRASVSLLWLGAIAYTLQIYFDFSGYSDMAIGLGRMFGFRFEENFRYPYMADSITEFWRRWHISLSTWFREYVYIPLGGNRVGKKRQVINLLIVWSLTGLWHGAEWNFMFWGLYYGVLLIGEKFVWGKGLRRMPRVLRFLYTDIAVVIGWVFFFSAGLGKAFAYIGGMFGVGVVSFWQKSTAYLLITNRLLLPAAILGSTSLVKRLWNDLFDSVRCKWAANFLLLVLLIVSVAYLIVDSYNPFIYFRF